MSEPTASPGQATWLNWLPLPAVILGSNGSTVAVNPAWASLWPEASGPDRWLEPVEPTFRLTLGARLRLAAATGAPGTADCQVAGPRGSRWSRWWWHPAQPPSLVVCVAVLDDGQPGEALPMRAATHGPPPQGLAWAASAADLGADRVMTVTDRIFEAGLALESVAGLLEGPLVTLAQRAIDSLDQLVHDIRSTMLEQQGRPAPPPPP